MAKLIHIPLNQHDVLEGDLVIPSHPKGLVLFAHGSGSHRQSPRNVQVATFLNQRGFGTLLFGLLTIAEKEIDDVTAELRFNIPLLAQRLESATRFVLNEPRCQSLSLGYFGASTGSAAALIAATEFPHEVKAIVSRGGRPDLAMKVLAHVNAPTLFIVGGFDEEVIQLNEIAAEQLSCIKKIAIVPGATHLFEEPGTLEQVCELATTWFEHYL